MNFRQWLEAYRMGEKDVENIAQSLNLNPKQHQFNLHMQKQKFGRLENKYEGKTNLSISYDEKDDLLVAWGFLIEQNLYLSFSDEPYEFPISIVQQIVNKYFTQHTIGLLFPAMFGGGDALAGEPKKNVPYLMDIEDGNYWLALDLPNVSAYDLNDLEARLDRYLAVIDKANAELDQRRDQIVAHLEQQHGKT